MAHGGNGAVFRRHKTYAAFTMMMASNTGVQLHLDTGNYSVCSLGRI